MKTDLHLSPRVIHHHRTPKLYALAGMGTLLTASWLICHHRRNAALLVAQWSAPLLLAALHDRWYPSKTAVIR